MTAAAEIFHERHLALVLVLVLVLFVLVSVGMLIGQGVGQMAVHVIDAVLAHVRSNP